MRKTLTLLFLPFFLLANLTLQAQVKTINGKITAADDGTPLPGVSIQLKGTSNGTTTDASGNFKIQVSGSNQTLVISSIGYLTREIGIGNQSSINITLTADSKQLEEVVVSTAMGITRQKKSLGYAAQGVKSEDLNFNHQPNVINALQGKIAGATITSVGGGPGQGANIRIRGVNSIDASISGDPLYVIDGVQVDNSTSIQGAGSGNSASTQSQNVRSVGNRISDINPDDIETINILKGGAATALYGLRGANGVVVITTKKGTGNGVRVGFSSSYGIDNINKTPEIQQEYTAGILGVYTPIGLGPAWGPTIAEAKAIDPTHPDFLYNNYDRAFETGNQFRNSVNITGGTDAVKVFSSLSALQQDGMLPFTDYKNLSARINTDITVSSKIKAGVNISFTNSGGYRYDADRFGESLTYYSGRWDVKDYINPDGTQVWRGTNNPIYGAATNRLKDKVNRLIGGFNVEYNPLTWLNFSYRIGVDNYTDNRFRTAPGKLNLPGENSYDNADGFVGEYNSAYRAINSTLMTQLSTELAKDLKATLRLGFEVYDRHLKDQGVLGSILGVYNDFRLTNAKVLTPTQNITDYRSNGYFGEATFDYKNLLFLSVTGRNDITSSLAPDKRSFFYPSASLSYVFSDQFKLPSFINQSKLRLSYARIGKDAPPYSSVNGFANYLSLPPGMGGVTLNSTLGDPDLKPEFTNTYEAGLEMAFLNNRLSFDATYYYSLGKDQITRVQISSATGYGTAFINVGDIRNKGLELVLNGIPVKTQNFKWESSLNFSANRNKVLKLNKGLTEIVYGESAPTGGYGNSPITMKLLPGQPYGNIYGSYYLRYYGTDTEDPVFTDESRPIIIGANGFPTNSSTKQKLLGNTQPDWIAGFSNTFSYKNISLSTLFDARVGFEKFNRLENFNSAFGIADYTRDRRDFKVFEGVLADGTPNTKSVWLGQTTGPDGVNYGEGYYRLYHRVLSEPFVQDASWVRLRSASLSYRLPTNWLPKNSIRNVAVSVTGNNLWLWTKYYGLDPESVSADSGSNVDGAAGFTYPSARSFLFTLNVGF
ncbi:MAG TPA: SusC/RagA family TonB-linked outer membrane protein [Pedobacter sp.]|uniref:SusC/RagA family TonB-linked outer membrane protein n=1 Tax=Pedobacter sp. TaxID=1411316 RepID=UPI002CB55A9D|nr:SusC/RagA family TonB-linked outer membrane protein [Pedobacter sp.]HMI04710.1 SusC/RagA family TonB-linked outer membrane protein [Pedobacter sp.]